MSSTRRTRSPGLDPEAAPELTVRRTVVVADLLREDRPHAELATGLEGEDDAAGRRAGHEVDSGGAVIGAMGGRPRTRTARSSPRDRTGPRTSRRRRRRGGRSSAGSGPRGARRTGGTAPPSGRQPRRARDASRAGLIVVIAAKSSGARCLPCCWTRRLRSVLDALCRRRARLPRQRGPDERRVRVEPAAAALSLELVDEPDRQRRVGEDRRADLDRDGADGEEVEDVGELGDAADRDDRDVDDLGDLVDDPQRDRLDRGARQTAVDVAEQRLRSGRRDGDARQRVDRGQGVRAGVGDGAGDRPDVGDVRRELDEERQVGRAADGGGDARRRRRRRSRTGDRPCRRSGS